MNRTQRRAAMRGKRQQQERVIPLPRHLDEFTIFDIPQTILDRIEHGAIEAANGVPIFRDNTGEWHEVCPALSGWIYTWQRISDSLALGLDLQPLQRVHNKLQASMPLNEADIKAAQTALTATRKAFRTADRQQVKAQANTAQIAILMQDKAA